MKTLRYISVYVLLSLLAFNSYAGGKLPVDPSGEVVFRQSFKLHANFTEDDAYALVQQWFTSDASKFTCQAGEAPNVNSKNRALVEEAFSNPQPLQSLDPASSRLAGRGLIKYYGGANSNISLLYMEYYILVEVSGNLVTATISKMKYHHFNQRTYSPKPIYGWQGGKPFDPADKLENLVNTDNVTRETQDVGEVVSRNINGLFSDLKGYLENKKAIAPQPLTANSGSSD